MHFINKKIFLAMNLNLATLALLMGSSFLMSCTDHSKPNVEVIQDFMEAPTIKAQEYDEDSPHHSGMRVPPENTAPVGFTPYKYGLDVNAADKDLKNPLAGQMTEDVLKVGMKFYETNCMVCHGMRGDGGENSSVGKLMALKPPSMLSEKIVSWSDGHLYHVISIGQGVMGPYASHIPQAYRWQVVNYVRHLQQENK